MTSRFASLQLPTVGDIQEKVWVLEDKLAAKTAEVETQSATLRHLSSVSNTTVAEIERAKQEIRRLESRVKDLEDFKSGVREKVAIAHNGLQALVDYTQSEAVAQGMPSETGEGLFHIRKTSAGAHRAIGAQATNADSAAGEEEGSMRKRKRGKGSDSESALTFSDEDSEPWVSVDDFRTPFVTYGDLPESLFDLIRRQMDGWDIQKPSWASGTKTGEPICADEWAEYGFLPNAKDDFTCSECVDRRLVCVAVGRLMLQLQPLLPDKRGQAKKKDMAYWVLDD
ncbi:MAG: hypothetical protein Q9181_007548 [Wetmoreana brouardii]